MSDCCEQRNADMGRLIQSLEEQIKDYEEALKEIRESYYPGGADLIYDIATEVLEKWRKGDEH